MEDTYRDILESAVYDYSGATTSSHVGHSAQMPSVPSSFSYSTSSHGDVIRSSQFGQRPRLRVSSGMERGWKERVTVFLPRKNCPSLEISVSQCLAPINRNVPRRHGYTYCNRHSSSGKQSLVANGRRRELVIDLTVAMIFGIVCELLRNAEFTAHIRGQAPLDARPDIHWLDIELARRV